MIKTKVAFLEGRLLSANHSNWKSIQKLWLAGKIGPPKRPLLFWSCKQAKVVIKNCFFYENY